jgi:hypothetical protein
MPGAALRVDIVRPDDPAWESWLERTARDVFHTAGYHAYSEESGEGEARLIVVRAGDRGLAWPYLIREVGTGTGRSGQPITDITSVYGYAGPLAWGCQNGEPFIADAWREIQETWRAHGAITSFTRFHPLLGNAALAAGLRVHGSGTSEPEPIVDGGRTVSIDLTLGYDGARRLYGRDLRRGIDRTRRASVVTSEDTEWAELPTFARLYNETMIRLRASPYYLFQESDFRRLRDALGSHLHLLLSRVDGKVVAAGLFTDWHGLVEWYLVGTDADYAALSPAKALVDFAIEWAVDRGGSVLHIGGGRGGAHDSLLWFKSRFSPRRHEFQTGRWVLDPVTTAEVTEARRAALEPGTRLDPGFFPQYRSPIVELDVPAHGPAIGMERLPIERPRPLRRNGQRDLPDPAGGDPR